MNTLVMFKKETEDYVEKSNNITMITSSKSLEEFKSVFDKKVADFVKEIMRLNVFVKDSNSKLTTADYDSEEETENMKVFMVHYNNLDKYQKQNYLFEFEGQYIDMKKWFWNDEFIYEYEMYTLEDFVKMKLQETKEVPSFSLY